MIKSCEIELFTRHMNHLEDADIWNLNQVKMKILMKSVARDISK